MVGSSHAHQKPTYFSTYTMESWPVREPMLMNCVELVHDLQEVPGPLTM
jgi:hypothetical protein